jgi:hypothetical protein
MQNLTLLLLRMHASDLFKRVPSEVLYVRWKLGIPTSRLEK